MLFQPPLFAGSEKAQMSIVVKDLVIDFFMISMQYRRFQKILNLMMSRTFEFPLKLVMETVKV